MSQPSMVGSTREQNLVVFSEWKSTVSAPSIAVSELMYVEKGNSSLLWNKGEELAREVGTGQGKIKKSYFLVLCFGHMGVF